MTDSVSYNFILPTILLSVNYCCKDEARYSHVLKFSFSNKLNVMREQCFGVIKRCEIYYIIFYIINAVLSKSIEIPKFRST